MANPDFQDESTFDQQGAGPTTVFMPAAWAANQIALLFIATDGGVPTLSTPNGFVLATDPNGNSAGITTNGGVSGPNDCAIHVFWKRLVGSTSATDPAPVVAAASTWGGTIETLHINTYINCRTTGLPFHIIATAAVTTATTTIAPPAVTPTLNGCTLVTCVASANDDSAFNAWTFTGAASPSGQLDNGWHGSTGNGASFCGGRGGYATTGGARSGTSTFATATKQAQVTIALASLPEVGVPDDEVWMAGTSQAAPPAVVATAAQEELPIAAATIADDVPSMFGATMVYADARWLSFGDELPIAAAATITDDVPQNDAWVTCQILADLRADATGDDAPIAPAPSIVEDDANRIELVANAPLLIGIGDTHDTMPSTGSTSVLDDEPTTFAFATAPALLFGAIDNEDIPNGSLPPVTLEDTPTSHVLIPWLPAPPPTLGSIDELPIAAPSAGIGGASDIQRSFEAPPQSGTLTTVAPIPSWAQSTAYVVDPTAGGINRVKNNGILYQCSVGGTSASSGTGPNATTFNTTQTDGTVTWYVVGPVFGTDTLAGSQLLATVMRGNQSQTPGGAIDPTDNDGGTYSVITNNAYLTFPASFAGVWRRTAASNAKTGYTISAQFGGSSGAGDELSAAWIELRGVVVGAPHAFSHVERASPTSGTVTAASITTTKQCLILSFWYGNGTVQPAGQPDTATPAGGLTLIANASAPLSLTVNGYVQHMVASRIANPGTFAEVWTASPTSQGAQLNTIAYELTTQTLTLAEDVPSASAIVLWASPTTWTTNATDEAPTRVLDAESVQIATYAPVTDIAAHIQRDDLPASSVVEDVGADVQPLLVASMTTVDQTRDEVFQLLVDDIAASDGAMVAMPALAAQSNGADDLAIAPVPPTIDEHNVRTTIDVTPFVYIASSDADAPAPLPLPGDDEPFVSWTWARAETVLTAGPTIDVVPSQVVDDIAWTFSVSWTAPAVQTVGTIDDEILTPPAPPPAGQPDDEVSWSSGAWSAGETVWSPFGDELPRFTAAPPPLPIRVRVIHTAATVVILTAPGELVPEPFRQGATHRPLECNAFNIVERINFPRDFPGGVSFLMTSGSTRVTGPAQGDSVGNLTYAWAPHDLDVPGDYDGYFIAIDGAGATQTFPDGTNLQIVVTPAL